MSKNDEISVFFRITGTYFGSKAGTNGPIEVKFPRDRQGNIKVVDVMQAVKAKVDAGEVDNVCNFVFSPAQPAPYEDLVSVTVCYDKKPKSNETGMFGYTLRDTTVNGPESLTLQYYIFDAKMKQLNTNNFSRRYSQYPDVEIKDKYTVIWRQLNIVTSPNATPLEIARAVRSEGEALV